MVEALVSPEVLRWARVRADLSLAMLAEKLQLQPDKVAAWESGEMRPTFRQAEKVATILHVPFGYLFLDEPPEERLPLPDLRTRDAAQPDHLGADALDLLRDVLRQHDWYREYLLDQGAEPLPFVGQFGADASVDEVAADIRRRLDMDADDAAAGDFEQRFSQLCDRCEEIGVWVMRAGVVAGNPHRPLSTDDFQGFAIADPVAPLVFVNGRDAKAAQIFTLAHELAHIWLGSSGISHSNLGDQPIGIRENERRCNAIAAEVLAPRCTLLALWRKNADLEWNVEALSRRFKVSRIVIARAAADAGLISWGVYKFFFEQEIRFWNSRTKISGGNFYLTAPVRNGKRFTNAVVNSAMSGALLLRDAGGLLHMKPATVRKLYQRNISER
ncbi:MAG TPA: XRE family transcriptional regulator [Azospirillaceae bacterium]|nr:XRE family transcriptional regulator [Azospirillaceae bacterium]